MQNLCSAPFQFRSNVFYNAGDSWVRVLQRRLDTMQARGGRFNTKGLSVRANYSHPKVPSLYCFILRENQFSKLSPIFFRLIAHKEDDGVTVMVPRKVQVCECTMYKKVSKYKQRPTHTLLFKRRG